MSGGRDIVDAAGQLGSALEETAAALGAADLDGVLRGQLALQLALEQLASRRSAPVADRAALREEVDRARRALHRCRQLGGMLQCVVRVSLEAQGRAPGYGRHESRTAVFGSPRVNTQG
jgi:hypothetical protein